MQKLIPSDGMFPTRRLEIKNFHRSQFQNTFGSIHVLVPPGFSKPNAWVIKVSKRACCAIQVQVNLYMGSVYKFRRRSQCHSCTLTLSRADTKVVHANGIDRKSLIPTKAEVDRAMLVPFLWSEQLPK